MQMLNKNAQASPQTQNNPVQMLQQFQQFAKGMTPQQAKQLVEQKLQSGEITQQQLENARRQAQQFASMFGIK